MIRYLRLCLYVACVYATVQHNRDMSMVHGQRTHSPGPHTERPKEKGKNIQTRHITESTTSMAPLYRYGVSPGKVKLTEKEVQQMTTPCSMNNVITRSIRGKAGLLTERGKLAFSCPDNGNLTNDPQLLLNYHKCVDVFMSRGDNEKYWIVSICPEDFNDVRVKAKCESPDKNNLASLTPGTSPENGLHYRNVYCARCHGITNLAFWTVVLPRPGPMIYMLEQEIVEYWPMLAAMSPVIVDFWPNFNVVTCDGPVKIVSSCPAHASAVSGSASTHVAYVATCLIPSVIFQNTDIYACSIIGKKPTMAQVCCLGKKTNFIPRRPVSMQVLLNFNAELCEHDQKYDESMRKCVSNDVRKVLLSKNILRSGSQQGLWRVPNFISCDVTMSINNFIPDITQPEGKLLYGIAETRFAKSLENTIKQSRESNLFSVLRITVKLNTSTIDAYHKANRLNSTSVGPPLFIQARNLVYVDVSNALLTKVEDLILKIILTPWYVFIPPRFNVTLLPSKPSVSVASSVVDGHLMTSTILNSTESDNCNWTETLDTGPSGISHEMLANISESCGSNGSGLLSSTADSRYSYNEQTAGIVTYACMTLSCMGLTAVLAVYGSIPALRTFVSTLTMNLSACLLLSQLLFMTGIEMTKYRIPCRVISGVLHYAWLCAIFWMNACGFHMFRMFRTLESALKVTRRSERYRLCPYVLYCYVTPLLIVALGLLIDLFIFEQKGYGVYYCFINNKILLTYTFAVPVAGVILTNTIFLGCSMRTMKILSASSQPGITLARSSILMCAKLSSVLGLTWAVGFVATLTGLAPLWYVFDVVNGLQGVVIFATYVLPKRTICAVVEHVTMPRPSANIIENGDFNKA